MKGMNNICNIYQKWVRGGSENRPLIRFIRPNEEMFKCNDYAFVCRFFTMRQSSGSLGCQVPIFIYSLHLFNKKHTGFL